MVDLSYEGSSASRVVLLRRLPADIEALTLTLIVRWRWGSVFDSNL
jgi:hypothetical protein